MRVEIKHGPSYAIAYCVLDEYETVRVEQDAMAWMSDGLKVSADIGGGGVVKAALRSRVGKEGFIWATYTAKIAQSWVAVAPPAPGDITAIDLRPDGPSIRSETGAILAMNAELNAKVSYGGIGNAILKEGIALVETSGSGTLLLGSYGAIEKLSLDEGQRMTVDSGHLVAWEDTINIRTGTLQGAAKSVLTGEGFVAAVSGHGNIWLQTRAERALESWLFPEKKQNKS
jgi:uncharacterized protein (TIGR00266 family)